MLHGADGDELRAPGAPFAADDGRVVARGREGDCGLHVHVGALVVVVAGGERVSWDGKGTRGTGGGGRTYNCMRPVPEPRSSSG